MLKVVIVGPESTGKTTLAEHISQYYNTIFVEEYARIYLEQHGLHYNEDTLLTIAKGQLFLEQKQQLSCKHNLLIYDTNLYVLKVWSEFVFHRCHTWILNQLATQHYDLYILTDIDFPWQEDPMRENPDPRVRKQLYDFYKSILVGETTSWASISGTMGNRLTTSLQHIDALLGHHSKKNSNFY